MAAIPLNSSEQTIIISSLECIQVTITHDHARVTHVKFRLFSCLVRLTLHNSKVFRIPHLRPRWLEHLEKLRRVGYLCFHTGKNPD